MGVLRSLRQINQQSKQTRATWDPVAQTRHGLAMMQAATAQLAESNAAATLVMTGTAATGTVLAAHDTGTRINLQPLVELHLMVTLEERPPYPLTLRTAVPMTQLAALATGAQLSLRVDPARPQQALVLWNGHY